MNYSAPELQDNYIYIYNFIVHFAMSSSYYRDIVVILLCYVQIIQRIEFKTIKGFLQIPDASIPHENHFFFSETFTKPLNPFPVPLAFLDHVQSIAYVFLTDRII